MLDRLISLLWRVLGLEDETDEEYRKAFDCEAGEGYDQHFANATRNNRNEPRAQKPDPKFHMPSRLPRHDDVLGFGIYVEKSRPGPPPRTPMPLPPHLRNNPPAAAAVVVPIPQATPHLVLQQHKEENVIQTVRERLHRNASTSSLANMGELEVPTVVVTPFPGDTQTPMREPPSPLRAAPPIRRISGGGTSPNLTLRSQLKNPIHPAVPQGDSQEGADSEEEQSDGDSYSDAIEDDEDYNVPPPPHFRLEHQHQQNHDQFSRSRSVMSGRNVEGRDVVVGRVGGRKFEWEIPTHEIYLGRVLGEGGFGRVHEALWNGTPVAVKVFTVQQLTQRHVDEFVSEVSVLCKVRHPNVLLFLGAATLPPHLCIVTELMHRSLFDVIHDHNTVLSMRKVVEIMLNVACAMNYLHSQDPPIIHRDLKSANLLTDANLTTVKVADFGLARTREIYSGHMTAQRGTFQWMAPEMIVGDKYGEPADVHSFGVIMWECISRKLPYEDKSGISAAMAVVTSNLRPRIPKRTHPVYADLMQRCWHPGPSQRPTFATIITELRQLLNTLPTH